MLDEPLPQIYRTDGTQARQWYQMWKYQRPQHLNTFRIKGVMTQQRACSEVGCDPSIANTQKDGYMQLWTLMNDDEQVVQCGSAEAKFCSGIDFHTDVSWNQ